MKTLVKGFPAVLGGGVAVAIFLLRREPAEGWRGLFQDTNGDVYLAWWVLLGALGVGLAFRVLGAWLTRRMPRTSVWLTDGWFVGVVAVAGAVTYLVTGLGALIEQSVTGGSQDPTTKAFGGVAGGLLALYLAKVLTDDLEEGEGSLWPAGIVQKRFLKAFQSKFKPGTLANDAAMAEGRVVGTRNNSTYDFTGWGFSARRKRALLVSKAPTSERVPAAT